MTTPFGIRHVSSTTAGSCASPGRSAQKLYLYAFGMLPCTMMNNRIGTPSGTNNTHVWWASTTYVRILLHHRGKRERYQKCLLNRSCRMAHPRHILARSNGKRDGCRNVEVLCWALVAVYSELPHATARLSLGAGGGRRRRGLLTRVLAPRVSPHICNVAEETRLSWRIFSNRTDASYVYVPRHK